MADTHVKMVAEIDATSRGLIDALKQASGAVSNTAGMWKDKFNKINEITDSISTHVQNLSTLLASTDGTIDASAIDAEVNALRTAQLELSKTSMEMDGLAQYAQRAGNSIKDVGDNTGHLTDKVRIAGVSLKDLREAFSGGAQSAAAMGAVYQQVLQNIISMFRNAKKAIDDANSAIKRIEGLNQSVSDLKITAEIEDTGKIASKMKELYALREKWAGTEEEKAREKILQEEIEYLQKFQKEEDKIAIAIDGQTVAQEELRKAIADTLELEQQMQKNFLSSSIENDVEALKKINEEIEKIDGLPDDFISNTKRQLGMLISGDIGGFIDSGSVGMKALSGFNLTEEKLKQLEEYTKLIEKIKKQERELKQLNSSSSADNFYFPEIAKQQDKENQAKIQLEEESKQLAEEQDKKRLELIEAMDKRIDAYKVAYQQYLNAENEVEKAMKSYADAEKNLAKEAKSEAMQKQRENIKKKMAEFGFSLPTGFKLNESVNDRIARVKNLKLDEGISEKMQKWQSGKRVLFTQDEKARINDLQGLKDRDKQLEISQKQMQAAERQKRAAEALENASKEIRKAIVDRMENRSSLRNAGREVMQARSNLMATGVRGVQQRNISYNGKFDQLHKDLQNILKKAYFVK